MMGSPSRFKYGRNRQDIVCSCCMETLMENPPREMTSLLLTVSSDEFNCTIIEEVGRAGLGVYYWQVQSVIRFNTKKQTHFITKHVFRSQFIALIIGNSLAALNLGVINNYSDQDKLIGVMARETILNIFAIIRKHQLQLNKKHIN